MIKRTYLALALLSLATFGLTFVAPQAQAHGDHACKKYWKACKASDDKHQCMMDAATKAKDQACLDHMANEKPGAMGKSAPPPPPPPAAPAGAPAAQ